MDGSEYWAEAFELDSLNDREASQAPVERSDIKIAVFSVEESDRAMCIDLEAERNRREDWQEIITKTKSKLITACNGMTVHEAEARINSRDFRKEEHIGISD